MAKYGSLCKTRTLLIFSTYDDIWFFVANYPFIFGRYILCHYQCLGQTSCMDWSQRVFKWCSPRLSAPIPLFCIGGLWVATNDAVIPMWAIFWFHIHWKCIRCPNQNSVGLFKHWMAFCRCSRAIWIASERKANFHAPHNTYIYIFLQQSLSRYCSL